MQSQSAVSVVRIQLGAKLIERLLRKCHVLCTNQPGCHSIGVEDAHSRHVDMAFAAKELF